MAREATWEERQARTAVKEARRRAGHGWSLLGDDLRRALVASEIVSLMLMQAEETLSKNPALGHIVDAARLAYAELGDSA